MIYKVEAVKKVKEEKNTKYWLLEIKGENKPTWKTITEQKKNEEK